MFILVYIYGLKDLFTLHTLADQVVLSLNIKTDDVRSGRRDVDLHRRLRGANGLNVAKKLATQNCNAKLH